MSSSRDRLLQHCTVKLVPANSSNWGTGFLVTPNRILTCAHVVAGHEVIPLWWREKEWATTATVEQILPPPVDLALLQIEPPEGEQPPCVLLSEAFTPFDRLYVYGYPDDFREGGSVTIQCEGDVQEQGVTLIKAQKGQVRPGHSGSPALNWETGRVCGVVSDTRSRSTDLGGLLIPVSTVFSHFPDLQTQNQAAHSRNSLWRMLPLQALAESQLRSPLQSNQGNSPEKTSHVALSSAQNHNLTEKQQNLLKWMIREVRAGKLNEEEIWFIRTFSGTSIMDYQGMVPDIKPATLDALQSDKCIIFERRTNNEYKFSLTRRAYDIADSIPDIELQESDTSKK